MTGRDNRDIEVFVSDRTLPQHKWSLGRRTYVVLGVVVVVIAIIGTLLYLRMHNSAHKVIVTPVAPLTAAQEHIAQAVVRTDGAITKVTSDSLSLAPSDKSAPLTLQTTKATTYSDGGNGGKGTRAALVEGHKAVVTYDETTNVASSVWADYDD